jgi:hypothetical protein
MKLDNLMLTKQKFSKMIEEKVSKTRGGYMDTILDLCEEHGIEVIDVKKFISPVILNKLTVEAEKNNLLTVKNSAKNELTFD